MVDETGYGIAPKQIFCDSDLSIGAKALSGLLLSFQGKTKEYSYPSIEFIGHMLGKERHAIHKYINELLKKPYFKKVRFKRNDKKFANNLYFFDMNVLVGNKIPLVENIPEEKPTVENTPMEFGVVVEKSHAENMPTKNNMFKKNSLNKNNSMVPTGTSSETHLYDTPSWQACDFIYQLRKARGIHQMPKGETVNFWKHGEAFMRTVLETDTLEQVKAVFTWASQDSEFWAGVAWVPQQYPKIKAAFGKKGATRAAELEYYEKILRGEA